MSVASAHAECAPVDDKRVCGIPLATTMARRLLVAAIICLVAGLIRFWNPGAIFESSDQCAMAHMIHHCFGLKWIFAHDYGPTLPVLQRAFSTLFNLLRIPSSEAACRFPVALVSLGQVLATYPLLKRMRVPAGQAAGACLCVAIVPTLVTDAHYAWGYLTVWLFTGTIALWATLAWCDDRRPVQLATAGLALFLHCLANVFALGLPVTLLAIWIAVLRRSAGARCGPAETSRSCSWWSGDSRAAAVGFILPCVGALAVMFLSWRWTGAGQIGRLLLKQHRGALFGRISQLIDLPVLWHTQFGYVFGVVAAAGLAWGCLRLARPESRRLGLLAVWALVSAFPLVFMMDWAAMGYPNSYLGSYFIEVVYCAGALGGVLMWRVMERLSSRLITRMASRAILTCVLVWLGVGTADECLFGGHLLRLTGVSTRWGCVRPDTGIKAAGSYVREYVPRNCVILCLHDNRGMEVPVAEFYTGRRVLAGYDLKPRMYQAILDSVGDLVDVVIVDAAYGSLMDKIPAFERTCTIRRDTRPVRLVYARRSRGLPHIDEETSVLNARYDGSFAPQHVPVPLDDPPGFRGPAQTYESTVKQLRLADRNGTLSVQVRRQ